MVVHLLRQLQLLYNRLKNRNHPQRTELENVFFELARLGIPPRQKIKEVKRLLHQNQVEQALTIVRDIGFDNIANVQVKRFLDFSDREKLVYLEARHVSLTTPQAVVSLSRAVDYVINNHIPGAIVECGVFQGGSVIAMLRTLLLNGISDRDVYLYDTFEGMPSPDENDVFYTDQDAATMWRHYGGAGNKSRWVYDSLDSVKQRVLSLGYPHERIHFIKGRVEETIPETMPDRIGLLRLDTDFYQSTKHELVHLYPLLSRGGILIVDDYGVFRGAQKATDEFIRETGTPMFLSRVDEAVRVAVKI